MQQSARDPVIGSANVGSVTEQDAVAKAVLVAQQASTLVLLRWPL
jgi:hypothetical protein